MTHNEDILKRWDNYFLARGEKAEVFWSDYLSSEERSVLYVLGAGFDARMCMGINLILNGGSPGRRDVFLIEINHGMDNDEDVKTDLKEDNIRNLRSIFGARGNISEHKIDLWREDEGVKKRVGQRRAGAVFTNNPILTEYSDIILDISSLPRLIYYPILTSLIDEHSRLRSQGHILNVHVIVADDVNYDANIEQMGLDETAESALGFSASLSQAANDRIPKIWLPVLGEGRTVHLERIQQFIIPDEVAPLVPWPSRNPRRADELLVEYHSLLFETFESEPSSIIYAPESNPFAVYRALKRAGVQYHNSLKSLGGCVTVISSLSSKLLSIGALLAAYNLKEAGYPTAIVQLDGKSYSMKQSDMKPNAELYSLWIVGECYED